MYKTIHKAALEVAQNEFLRNSKNIIIETTNSLDLLSENLGSKNWNFS
jgi:hypothetical protein